MVLAMAQKYLLLEILLKVQTVLQINENLYILNIDIYFINKFLQPQIHI